ncbi:MAG: DUF423 domain-containing protein [Phaeodactylibacter sp.]|nr:DUF423 domain-containing protein [Phaeodactylibacter sp.]
MNKQFFVFAALLAMTAVILGAFGAHVLEGVLTPDQLNTFETGVRYQFYHALALFLVSIFSRYISSKLIHLAGWFFIVGVVLFSGSIYLLACQDVLNIQDLAGVLGPITPIGGLGMILGWLFFMIAGIQKR